MKLPAAPATAPGFCYGLPGAIAPFGNFDPAGVTDGRSLADVYRLREAEVQHGRVAMVACLGFLTEEAFHPLGGDFIYLCQAPWSQGIEASNAHAKDSYYYYDSNDIKQLLARAYDDCKRC